ncbi:hypothetical protein CARN8_950002 [mine drainage metagenome]|uniref:Uncharacterized protein n=1 Tax=mine drainage metagenome TaxID=410659 RepID=A0A3P3ZSE9_9ZZZZ
MRQESAVFVQRQKGYVTGMLQIVGKPLKFGLDHPIVRVWVQIKVKIGNTHEKQWPRDATGDRLPRFLCVYHPHGSQGDRH